MSLCGFHSSRLLSNNRELRAFWKVVLFLSSRLLWNTLLLLSAIQCALHHLLKLLSFVPSSQGVAQGRTVLVTTGRQAKTLHTVRALKASGARVLVSDYDDVSTSRVSIAADGFILLPPLTSSMATWVREFRKILEIHQIDVVVPASTINEVLALALAKDILSQELPHIQWLSPGLETALALDDRTEFANLCTLFNVPAPESGVLTSREGIKELASKFPHGIMAKRIESSVNRLEEVVHIRPGEIVPSCVQPSLKDKWQWQRFVRGSEASVWYVCVDGEVTFSACYKSEADLLHFDATHIPTDLDLALRDLIHGMNLSGQYAFDFLTDDVVNVPLVIECNPRSSSVLETVSETPGWGDAFFGVKITTKTVKKSVGFFYHKNCWPWVSGRVDGHLKWWDPLPMITAQIVWPIHAIAKEGLTEKLYKKIDVNICKVIVPGPSPPRNIATFRKVLANWKESQNKLRVS